MTPGSVTIELLNEQIWRQQFQAVYDIERYSTRPRSHPFIVFCEDCRTMEAFRCHYETHTCSQTPV